MEYLPPFEILKSYITRSKVRGELRISCSYDDLLHMLRRLIAGIEVDEAWYLERYQDIAKAVHEGNIQSAQLHFVNHGYFEGRLPFPILVDERYYLTQNSGIADHVNRGILASGQQHFDENGYTEGRLPFGL